MTRRGGGGGVISGGGGSDGVGYDLVQDEGSGLTKRGTMDFVGAGVVATDSGSKTVVTIAGGGGGVGDTVQLSQASIWVDPRVDTLPVTTTGGGSVGGALLTDGTTLYLIGGVEGEPTDVWVDAIYTAPRSDPSNWTKTGSTIPVALSHAYHYIIGDNAYIAGGKTAASTYVDTIYTAALSDLTSWSLVVGKTLPIAQANGGHDSQMLVVAEDKIYIWGGVTSTDLQEIYSATFAAPTTWTDTTETFPDPRMSAPGSYMAGDRIYHICGGDVGVSFGNTDIYSAPLADVTKWVKHAEVFPAALFGMSCWISGDTIYVAGGATDGGAAKSVIYAASVFAPTTFRTVGNLTAGVLVSAACIGSDGTVVLVAGESAAGAHIDDIQQTSGTVGASLTSETSLPSDYNPALAVLNDGTRTAIRSGERFGIQAWLHNKGRTGFGIA